MKRASGWRRRYYPIDGMSGMGAVRVRWGRVDARLGMDAPDHPGDRIRPPMDAPWRRGWAIERNARPRRSHPMPPYDLPPQPRANGKLKLTLRLPVKNWMRPVLAKLLKSLVPGAGIEPATC